MTNLSALFAPILKALKALARIAAALGSGRAAALLMLHASLAQAMQQLQDLHASWLAGTLPPPPPARAPIAPKPRPARATAARHRGPARRRLARRAPRTAATRPQALAHPTRAPRPRAATPPAAYARPCPPH